MSPALLLILIQQIAIPELSVWLRSRHDAGQTLTDADVLAKLAADTDLIKQIGDQWLAAHR
jgi:hypothetical protein